MAQSTIFIIVLPLHCGAWIIHSSNNLPIAPLFSMLIFCSTNIALLAEFLTVQKMCLTHSLIRCIITFYPFLPFFHSPLLLFSYSHFSPSPIPKSQKSLPLLPFGLVPMDIHLLQTHRMKRLSFQKCLVFEIIKPADKFHIGSFEGTFGINIV